MNELIFINLNSKLESIVRSGLIGLIMVIQLPWLKALDNLAGYFWTLTKS